MWNPHIVVRDQRQQVMQPGCRLRIMPHSLPHNTPHLCDRLQVLKHVGRVGHSEPQHHAPVTGQRVGHAPEQRRDVGADVAPVGAGVLTAEPDLANLGEGGRRGSQSQSSVTWWSFELWRRSATSYLSELPPNSRDNMHLG